MKCEVFVPLRAYGKPGPCQRRDVRRVKSGKKSRRLCGIHRAEIAANGCRAHEGKV